MLDGVKESDYIKYAEKVDCVVLIVGVDEESKVNSVFSGVMLTPKWLITAAHTLGYSNKYYVISADQKHRHEVKEFIKHPEFNIKKAAEGDISLGYLGSEYNIDFYPKLYDEKKELNKVCCMFGYGKSGYASVGATKHDGIRRGGSNIIDTVEENLLICEMSKIRATSLEFCVAIGDSGGGMFIDKKLAGINCCVFHKNSSEMGKYGDSSGFTRISSYVDWIRFIIND